MTIKRLTDWTKPKTMRWPSERELLDAAAHVMGAGAPPAPGQPPLYNGNAASFYDDTGSGSEEASRAKFSPEGGSSSRIWDLQPGTAPLLLAAIQQVLGWTNNRVSGLRLNRNLPLADPIFPWMYASQLQDLQGYQSYAPTAALPTASGAASFPNGTLWQYYHMHLESLQRPYPVLPDSAIRVVTGQWYPEHDGGTTARKYQYAFEQMRFCNWEMLPQNDYVTQQKGQLTFFADDIEGVQFQGMPSVYLPNQLFSVTWFYVPLRLITSPSSYLNRWRGRVNQNMVSAPDGLQFNPGELLYLNYSMKIFTPPVPQITVIGGGNAAVTDSAKFCHITMNFLYTQRSLYHRPRTAITNKNYVVGGHNFLPGPDGRFRYATMSNVTGPFGGASTSVQNRQLFLSAPLELLWTDCNFLQAV